MGFLDRDWETVREISLQDLGDTSQLAPPWFTKWPHSFVALVSLVEKSIVQPSIPVSIARVVVSVDKALQYQLNVDGVTVGAIAITDYGSHVELLVEAPRRPKRRTATHEEQLKLQSATTRDERGWAIAELEAQISSDWEREFEHTAGPYLRLVVTVALRLRGELRARNLVQEKPRSQAEEEWLGEEGQRLAESMQGGLEPAQDIHGPSVTVGRDELIVSKLDNILEAVSTQSTNAPSRPLGEAGRPMMDDEELIVRMAAQLVLRAATNFYPNKTQRRLIEKLQIEIRVDKGGGKKVKRTAGSYAEFDSERGLFRQAGTYFDNIASSDNEARWPIVEKAIHRSQEYWERLIRCGEIPE
jgi:hypothetical protein